MKPLKIYMIAGEVSGDLLGGRLLGALNAQTQTDIRGIGGETMREQGLVPLFPMRELSLMGLAEILPKIPHMLRRIKETVADIEAFNPDVVVTIDAPDFSFRVVKALKAKGSKIPCVHYVAPSVWAWRPGRAKKVAQFLDHLLTLFPFEPPYFEKEGLSATFVGHSMVEQDKKGDGQVFRKKYNIPMDKKILALLPGSRRGETSRLLPLYQDMLKRAAADMQDWMIVVPTLPHLKDEVEAALGNTGFQCVITEDKADKWDMFAASDFAIAASGTVTLELAMAGLPHIITYKVNALTAFLGKFLIKTKYAGLPNIILEREAVPELIQKNATPEKLYKTLRSFLDDARKTDAQKLDLNTAVQNIALSEGLPSQKAAEAVIKVASE